MRFWTLRVCAVLLGLYALFWAYAGWVGFLGQNIANPPAGSMFTPSFAESLRFFSGVLAWFGVVVAVGLSVLAVFVWRGSRAAVVITLVPTIGIAIVLLLALFVLFSRGYLGSLTLWTLILLAGGPGLVAGLLVNPVSARIWSVRR